MEKLIELLNEYEAERHKTSIVAEIWWQNGDRLTYLGLNNHYSELLCISKGYEFIKRLVEHDKIDRTYRKDLKYPYYIDDKERDLKGYGKTDLLIMLLSIQDNPIEFLISILK